MCLLGSDYAINKAAQYWEAVHLYYVWDNKFWTGVQPQIYRFPSIWSSLQMNSTIHQNCEQREQKTTLPASSRTSCVGSWTLAVSAGMHHHSATQNGKQNTQRLPPCLPYNWGITGAATEMVGMGDHQTTQNAEQNTQRSPSYAYHRLRDRWHCDRDSRQGRPSNHTEWWTNRTLSCLP